MGGYFFGLIHIWECTLNWFTMEPIHIPKLGIYHLCGFKGNIPQTYFLVIPMLK